MEAVKGETILVVEDDPDLRDLMVQLLESLGHGVLPAVTGRGALETLQAAPCVDLLVADLVPPGGMSGTSLGRRVQELNPDLPVLYMSGYTKNTIIHHGRLDEGVQHLQKPFRRTDLARKLRRALDRGVPGETGDRS